MKKVTSCKVWKLALVFALSLSFLSVMTNSISLLANEETFEIEEHVKIGEDKTYADITFNIEDLKDGYSIESIENPDGSTMDMITNPLYTVWENGTYDFIIKYRENDTPELLEITTSVKVEGIETSDNKISDIQPLTTITDGGVTISIPAYDGVGWSNGEIKDLAIKVDFNGDNTTENKKVVITLPEGMRYEQVKTAGTFSTTNVDTSILSNYPSTDPLATAITKMELPIRETTGPKSTYGDLVVYFSAGTKTATIDLKVRVDGYKYYGPHTIKDPIEATLYMGSPTQELGSAEQSIDAIGESSGAGQISKTSYNTPTTQIGVSTSDETSYGLANAQRVGLYNPALSTIIGADRRFVKSAVIYMYYPEGMVFDSFVTDVNWSGSAPTIVDETSNNRIKITFTNGMSLFGGWIKYKVPEDATLGFHENPASDYAEITNYDGTTYTSTIGGSKYKVEVIDVSTVENKMQMSYSAPGNQDNITVANTKSYGPFFSVKNSTAGTKTDQMFEVTIDSNWQAELVRIPFDTSVSGNELKDIQYQTTKEPGVWKTYTPASAADVATLSNWLKQVSKDKVGLDDDEYFLALRANVGKFSSTYSLTYAANVARTNTLSTYGSLKSGVTSATVTMSLYDKNDASVKTTATGVINSSSVSGYKSSFNGSINYYDDEGKGITQIEAGNTLTVEGTMSLSFVSSTSTIMKAPEIYIRQPEGMTIAIDTLEIKDQDGVVIDGWTYTSSTNDEGEIIYKVKTPDTTYIGFYFDGDKTKSLKFTYDISTNVKLVGNYDGRDLVAWGNSTMTPLTFSEYVVFTDVHDFNGNDDITDEVFSFAPKTIKVVENKNMLVETFLSISGEDPKDPYVEGNSSSVAYFTPGTNADYTVKLTNNSDAYATGFETYIPIPKSDVNYGTLFQSDDFKWDMKLKEAVSVPAGYEVLYSTDATGANYASATYESALPSNLEDVKMVKIRATALIAPGASEQVKVSLIVDEDFDSATADNKIGKRNVYSPVYDVVSTSYTGTLSGTKVGAELVIAEVGGMIFVDKDADGLYIPENGDTPVSGHEVKLYKWDEDSGSYEPVIDPSTNQQYSVTSNSNGVYLFDYTTGMGYGKYAVEFVEKTGATYQYTINNSAVGKENINSDAIIANNIPEENDTYRGWAIDIDATKPVAKTIGCGFLKYNPPVDLSVSVSTTPNQVKVGDSIIVSSTVTPDFWESIKATTGAYAWSLDDSTNITLTNNNDGTVTVSPTALAAPLPDKTVNLTLTITDIYGNTKTSASVPIKILSNIAPTITVADTVAYVGDTVVDYSTGLSASDVTGNPMMLITATGGLQNAWISESVPQTDGKYTVAGSYKITYKVKDVRGNETSVDRLVRVHEKPTISANSATYLVTDTTIDAQVNALTSATWLEAPATEGAAVSRDVTSLITKTVTSEMGVTDFSKAGLYTVTFNLNVPVGGTASKTVQVLVKDPKDESKDGLTIHAENFVLEYADAQDLTLAKSITNGSVQAYAEIEKNGEIEKIEKLNNSAISVNDTQLKAIQSATIDGGIYKLTFTATKDSKTVSKEIEVLVKPKNAVVDGSGSLMLDAKAFVVDYEDAENLTEALAISNGSGQGYKVERNAEGEVTAITDVTSLITVDPTELTAIQSAPEEGGVYLLTYTLSDNLITLTKQVDVFVKPKGGNIDKDISLYATNLSLTYEDALNLTSADVLVNTKAKATKINKDSYGNITSFTDISSSITVDEDQIEKINNAKVSGGVFTVTLSVTDGLETKTKDIQVFVWPEKSVTVDDTTISANGFTLTTKEAKALDLTVAKKEANASAYALTLDGSNNVISARDISDSITVDENELKAIKETGYSGGLYAFTFTVTNGSTVATISVPVLVQQEAITNDLVIHANPFALENTEAKNLDEATAVNEEHANVMAYQIERDIYGNISAIQDISANVDIDTAELAAINATDSLGGIYPLTFSITNNGNTEETTIDVLVKSEKYITDPTGVLTLSVTGFEITEADASGFNESMALSKGNATSFKFELDEDGNILGFSDVSNNITVNKDELKTIKESGEGIYPLTYTITDGDITVSKTIYVVVTGKNTPSIVDGLAISGKDFTLTYDEALKLDQAIAIEKAEIISVLVNNDAAKARLLLDSEITLEVKGLDAINATTQKGGEYPLTFIASYTNEDGEIITNEVTVNVTVLEKGEVVINKPSIDGKDKPNDAKDVVATSDVTDINFLLSLCGVSFLLCLIVVSKRNKKEA